MSLMLNIFQYKYAIIVVAIVVGVAIYILLTNAHTLKKMKIVQEKADKLKQENEKQTALNNLQNNLKTMDNNLNKGDKGEQAKSTLPTLQFNREKLKNFKNQRLKSIVEKLKPEVQEIILNS